MSEFVTREEHRDDMARLDGVDRDLRRQIIDTERVLRGEMVELVHGMSDDLKADIGEVKIEMGGMRTMFQNMLKGQNKWALIILCTVAATIISYIFLVHFGVVRGG